jgi:hypothetical protein
MKLEDYRIVFITVGLIGVLLIASPAIAGAVRLPGEEKFSELYLLGPDHLAENYPFDITVGKQYSVYVDAGNHLGSLGYYILYLKFGNETDKLPNNILGAPSSLQPLYEYRFSIEDTKNWEALLTFSISDVSISTDNSQINTLQINNVKFNVDKSAVWDSNINSFRYQLIFELWIYDSSSGRFSFNDRFVNLQLNLIKGID